MSNLLEEVNKQFALWVAEEARQLRIIEESAANLVAAAKTHPARKPHLKRLRNAQKALETASEQCVHFTDLADFLNSKEEYKDLPTNLNISNSLTNLKLSPEIASLLESLQFINK